MKTFSLLLANLSLIVILLIGFPILIDMFSMIPFPGCAQEGTQPLIISGSMISPGMQLACKNGNTQPIAYLFIALLFISIIGIVFLKEIDFSTSLTFAGIASFYIVSVLSLTDTIPYLTYLNYIFLGITAVGVLMAMRYL